MLIPSDNVVLDFPHKEKRKKEKKKRLSVANRCLQLTPKMVKGD